MIHEPIGHAHQEPATALISDPDGVFTDLLATQQRALEFEMLAFDRLAHEPAKLPFVEVRSPSHQFVTLVISLKAAFFALSRTHRSRRGLECLRSIATRSEPLTRRPRSRPAASS